MKQPSYKRTHCGMNHTILVYDYAPQKLIYAPAIESRYLGKMTEQNYMEIAITYLSLCRMELALVRTGVNGGIKCTIELKSLIYNKAIQSPDDDI